jgi:hypothetical protein
MSFIPTPLHAVALRLCFALRTNAHKSVVTPPAAVQCFRHPSVRNFVHTTAPLHFKKGLFRSLFRLRRKHPTDIPSDPTKVTLFHQEPLPGDLRLPKPAEPLLRIGAGLLDGAVAAVAGSAAAAASYAVLGAAEIEMVAAAGQAVALSTWVFRDGFGDGGNRSLGKKVFKLEISYWDGALASRKHAALRSWYFILLPAMAWHPLVDLTATLMFVFDGASVFLTQDSRKLSDYMFGTRVVMESPDRAARLQEAAEINEIRMLREEIDSISPGLLETSTKVSDVWYENVQAALHTSAVAEAAAGTRKAEERVHASVPDAHAIPTPSFSMEDTLLSSKAVSDRPKTLLANKPSQKHTHST